MKQRFLPGIVVVIIMTMIASCTKDPISPSNVPLPPPSQATEIDFVASQWEQGLDGYYSRLEDALRQHSYARVRVYVKELADLLLIDANGVDFRDGHLWCYWENDDLVLRYMGADAILSLPFDHLEIKLVVE